MGTLLSVRFSGMCAFVSDTPDPNNATSFYVVMPDVGVILGEDPHLPTLSFKEHDYHSGGKSAIALHVPGGLQLLGVWSFRRMKLRITTGLAAPSLIKQGLGAIASVKEAGFPTEMIDADCIKKPASKPVAAVSKINEGILFCDPNDIGARGFSKDVELALQLEENLVRFELFDFDDQYQDGLQLASRDGQPIQITIANLSVPSFSSGAHDHSKAYGALLKQGGVGALGLGCQPTRMVRDFT